VLADAYVRASYYPRSDPALLRRGARTRAIVDHIARDGADVFCLQEVEAALITAARTRLAGWDIRYEQKPGKPDGCAICSRVPASDVRALVYGDGSGHLALLATVGERRIATTHIKWDPPGTLQRFAIRQARELVAARPDIACGDFNFEPDDEALRIFLDAAFTDPGGTATCNPNGRAKRIDYILVRGAANALPAIPVADDAPLPSPDMPSDHVPIAVELT
jgi:endonuclease/exonuclease/phosphatase family metal-dependent hydrolase